jgi:hypothetical protein
MQNLGRQKKLFSRTSLSIHSMNMSDLYAVLLVAPSSFNTALVLIDEDGSACNPEMMTSFHSGNTKRKRGTTVPIDRSRMKRSQSDAGNSGHARKE